MRQFIIRRATGAVLSLWIVMTLVFFAVHSLPGDPAQAALSQSTASRAVLERRREALGLNRPVYQQYIRYLVQLAHGNLGISWATGEPVSTIILDQSGPTIVLASTSMTLAMCGGFALGYLSVLYRQKFVRIIARVISGIAVGIPVMYSATILIWIFALGLHWLPATSTGGMVSLLLPALALGFAMSGSIAQVVEGELTVVLSAPYLVTARAKGLSINRAMLKHGLRVALAPILSIGAVQFGYLLSGTVITESLFARRGFGRVVLSAVLTKDIPVLQAAVVISASIYIVLNFCADLLQSALDPRIRTS
jgi:peptide/nickel transport system permease protein